MEKPTTTKIKRGFQNSVFCSLFELDEYRFELYRALHPEDKETKPDDVKIATLEQVLATNLYNDLCLQVKDRLLLFVEAQSTFSQSIAFRMFLYAANTYREYVYEHEIDYYHGDLKLPDAEFYVVYTGEDKDVPEIVNLSDTIKGVDMEIKVLIGESQKDKNIVYQYVRFCKLVKEKLRLYPADTKRALDEAITQCIQEGILVEFLTQRRKEIIETMDILFDQELVTKFREKRIAKEAKAEGEAEKQRDVAKKMLDMAEFTMEQIAQVTGLTLHQLSKLKAELR